MDKGASSDRVFLVMVIRHERGREGCDVIPSALRAMHPLHDNLADTPCEPREKPVHLIEAGNAGKHRFRYVQQYP